MLMHRIYLFIFICFPIIHFLVIPPGYRATLVATGVEVMNQLRQLSLVIFYVTDSPDDRDDHLSDGGGVTV